MTTRRRAERVGFAPLPARPPGLTSRYDKPPPATFSGETIEPEHDEKRLGRLLGAVEACMRDGAWRTLAEIRASIGIGTETSISARLRDLRKERFGGHEVERRRRGLPADGLWEYRLVQRRKAPHRDRAMMNGEDSREARVDPGRAIAEARAHHGGRS